MTLEYIEIDDPAFKATCKERNQHDYVLVRSKDGKNVPIKLPNWKPGPCCLNKRYQKIGQQIKDLKVHPDDVWLISYPKSGNTWCQEMIWLICNDLDYEKTASKNLIQRIQYLELSVMQDLPDGMNPLQEIISMPSPRFIKTHLPVALLPDQTWTVKPRLVYVKRNPKSVAVSYYHQSVGLNGYKGTLSEFLESFMKDLQYYSPFHRHVIEYHNLENQGNILYLCYEDMKMDLKSELKRVCAFFNKAYSDEQLDTLAQHLSFDKMKNNKLLFADDRLEYLLVDKSFEFFRSGKADGWKTELSEEQLLQLDLWTRKRVSDPEHLKLFH